VTPTVDDVFFVTEHRTEFRPLSRTAVIPRPPTDEPPDPDALGLPTDFPLRPDP
jgi:hypothetical protein